MADDSPTFELIETLAAGGFGIAYLVSHKVFGEVVFKKLLETSNCKERNRFQSECEIHKKLSHRNIVKYLGSHSDSASCGFFIEYLKYGAVDDFIENHTVLSQWKTLIMHDVSKAVLYLHNQQPGIVHGDLKPSNILIDDQYRAKVCDFGLSCLQKLTQTSNNSIGGTLPYIAPEYILNPAKQKTEKFDVYGFAISAWEIFSGKRHSSDFQVPRLITKFVVDGFRPSLEDIPANHTIPNTLLQLIELCWDKLELKRPTFKEIEDRFSNELSHVDKIADPVKKFFDPISESSSSHICQGMESYNCTNNSRIPAENSTSQDCNQFLKGFKAVRHLLSKYIDSENGLLMALTHYGLISENEYKVLIDLKPYKDRNDHMILYYIGPRIADKYKEFAKALSDNDQEHIVQYIIHSGQNEGEDRLLNDDEIRIIDYNMFGLVNLINPYQMEFLNRLVRKDCITSRHKDKVESHAESPRKVNELLTILKRRRYKDLCNFKFILHATMQTRIVGLLESIGLVAIRVELEERSDRMFIESALIAHLTDYVKQTNAKRPKLSEEQRSFVDRILDELENVNIHFIGSSSWKSMAVFFMCSSTDSSDTLQQIFDAGKLRTILEKVYKVLYKMPDGSPDLIHRISLFKCPFPDPNSSPGN